MATQRFYVSTTVVNDFSTVVERLGLVKKSWYSKCLFKEVDNLWFVHRNKKHRDELQPNSIVAQAFLTRRQRGKDPFYTKDVKTIYCDMPAEEVEEYKRACDFFKVSKDALIEFALAEGVRRVTSAKFRGRGRQDSFELYYLRHFITEPVVDIDKIFRMKNTLFCDDGIIPKSFKKKFRESAKC